MDLDGCDNTKLVENQIVPFNAKSLLMKLSMVAVQHVARNPQALYITNQGCIR